MKSTRMVALVMTAGVVLSWGTLVLAQGEDAKVDLPAAVKATVERVVPGAVIGPASQESKNGVEVYEVKLTKNGAKTDAIVATEGTLVAIESPATDALPAKVMAALRKKFPEAKVLYAEKIEIHADAMDGKLTKLPAARIQYVVRMQAGDKVTRVEVTSGGKVIKAEEVKKQEAKKQEAKVTEDKD